MFKNLVLATDFSDLSRGAYAAAAQLAREYESTIHLVHEAEAIPPFYYEHASSQFPLDDYYDRLEKRLGEEAKHPELEGCRVETHLLFEGGPYAQLLGFCEGVDVDLIVLATHGRSGLEHVLLGSFTEKIVRHAPVPVLTYRRRASGVTARGQDGAETKATAFKHLLVPFDFSENARAVLPSVRFFAHHYGARVTLLNVFPSPEAVAFGGFGAAVSYSDIEEEARAARSRAEQSLQEVFQSELKDVQTTCVAREGIAYREIVSCASEIPVDLILMTTHGRSGLKHFLLGSVAEKVVRKAPCSVLTFRPHEIRESTG